MSNPSQISAEEASRNAYRVFLFTLEALGRSPEQQCELMGDFNTAWELRDDALGGRYLLDSGIFTEEQKFAVQEFLATIDLVPINDMPSGAGRAVNLAAMQHPAWEPIREMAQQLIVVLEPVTRANLTYFQSLANVPQQFTQAEPASHVGLVQELDPSVSDPKTDTEFKLWADADLRQKSYLVQILHWFHYRPTRLKKSWKQEEVLTWELLRTLDVLPQSLFLRPLLSRIASSNAQVDAVVRSFGKSRIKVTPYPSLELAGNKRNCKSDIGLGLDGRPTIWIEAKTASFRASDLEAQLRQQESSMALLMPNTPHALITLLPAPRALSTFPNLSWDDVLAALHSCKHEVRLAVPESELSYGYCLLASELAERIESHPNRAKGWV